MSLFSKLKNAGLSAVSGFMKNLTGNTGPFEVVEIQIAQVDIREIIGQDDILSLYKDGDVYSAVLQSPTTPTKHFSLFRVQSNEEACGMFTRLCASLLPLCYALPKFVEVKANLQSYMDLFQKQKTWSAAHFAAKLQLTHAFRHQTVSVHLNDLDEATQVTPVQVAIETEHLQCIQELLLCGVRLNLADQSGENVFHWAAKCQNSGIIQTLASKDKSCINQLNVHGESALHVSCLNDRPENAEMLIRWGADPQLTMSYRYPAHCAMKANSVSCLMVLVRWSREQVDVKDTKYGGTPMHWAKTKGAVYSLAEKGGDVNARNKDGDTPLIVMIRRDRFEAVMALLVRGAKPELTNQAGENALHVAIKTDSYELVQTLIVFGAEVNYMNITGHTPRHLAARHDGKNRPYILYLLHRVGAQRCPLGVDGCRDGCEPNGTFNGTPKKQEIHTPEHHKKVLDEVVSKSTMSAALTRTNSASGSALMEGVECVDSPPGSAGHRVLCLDGGGIRGLILIQLLMSIERCTGQPLKNLFDWVAGTSTGGILALGIAQGKSARYAQGLYFRLKDDVFVGSRPYCSENLENFLKKEFGENTRMSDVIHPKVMVTGVLGDRNPAELHMFRNYEQLGVDYDTLVRNSQFELPPRPHDQYMWRAARSSGAAPTYFRAFGRFLDGGLISNNPTLDMMTEIHEYDAGLKAKGLPGETRPIHVVVSLGTGRLPPKPVNAVDVFKPEGVLDVYRTVMGAKNLAEMVVEAATQSEGRPVERARAWCNMISVPYFRLSPQLSTDIPLDCTDDPTLIHMLWETQCYIHEQWGKFSQLATLLWP